MASVVRYPYASLPHTHTITHAAALPLARATFSSALMQQSHVAITTPVPTSQPQPQQPHVQPQAQPQPQAKPVVVQQTQPSSSSSSSSSSSGPQLTVLRQHSSNEEKVTNHVGVSKTVHVVVKNAPFVMQVGVNPNVVYNRVINFNHLSFDAVLLYDTEPLSEKTVDYVKVRPLEHKVKVHDHGDQATIEVRIKVLTSQHENSFFRVKIAVLNPATNELYHPSLVAYSDPIKVISKPEQIKKKLPSKKRSLNDTVAETISRIEEQQVEQQVLIEKLLEQQKKNQQNMDTCFSLDALAGPNFSTSGRKEEKKESFEAAFSAFLSVYTSLKAEERPSKIRKLVRNSTTQETETISHLLEGLSSHGACRFSCAGGAKQSPRSTSSCACKVCPYQKELERIDEFYKDFLSAPLCSAPMSDLLELKL